MVTGTPLVVQWLRPHLPTQGVQSWSLVSEQTSRMPHSLSRKKKKKNHKTEIIKTFKMVHIKKKSF